MEEPHRLKRVVWIGSSRRDLKSFPDDVKRAIGVALYQAQLGGKAPSAKPLSGFRSAGVLEIVADYYSDTYRVVYTVRFGDFIYVLHAFQKKSKRGDTIPKHDVALIRSRLESAQEDYRYRDRLNEKKDSQRGGSQT
jgi:phage-related protein